MHRVLRLLTVCQLRPIPSIYRTNWHALSQYKRHWNYGRLFLQRMHILNCVHMGPQISPSNLHYIWGLVISQQLGCYHHCRHQCTDYTRRWKCMVGTTFCSHLHHIVYTWTLRLKFTSMFQPSEWRLPIVRRWPWLLTSSQQIVMGRVITRRQLNSWPRQSPPYSYATKPHSGSQ